MRIYKLDYDYWALLTWCYSHSRQETREGQLRAISKDYYYIDFHATIDAIKYRIFKLTEQVKDLYKPSQEKKDYHCPRCHAQWTQLEVLDNISPMGEFLCHRCKGVLERDDVSAADMAGHERQSKLMAQLDKLLRIMPEIDSQTIPKNDFETAFSHAIPIHRDEDINPARKMEAVETGRSKPSAVKGITITSAPLEVSLTTNAERAAAERAEAQRQAKILEQNKLPSWHTNSTVTGEVTVVGNKERERLAARSGGVVEPAKPEDDKKSETNVLVDELAAYYAQMAEEKAKEAQEDQSSAEDEDDEFEDVDVGASGVGTPSSSMSGAPNGSQAPPTNGKRLKQESESGSSAPGTNFSTPAASGSTLEEAGRDSPAKRVKLELPSNGVAITVGGLDGADEDSDEDEAEFEDALR